MKTNANELRGKAHPLYRRYAGQAECQPAHIDIDLTNRTAYAAINGEVGNAVPMTVWRGEVTRIEVSPYVDGDALSDWLDANHDLLTALCDAGVRDGRDEIVRDIEERLSMLPHV